MGDSVARFCYGILTIKVVLLVVYASCLGYLERQKSLENTPMLERIENNLKKRRQDS